MSSCGADPKATVNGTVTDPVCGMKVNPATAAGMSEYNGKRIFFCGKGCKQKFDADPAKYEQA